MQKVFLLLFFLLPLGWHAQAPADTPETFILGFSAQPPTYAHGLLLLKIQEIFQANHLFFSPAPPYKKDVEGGSASLELTKTAVLHFDEVLKYAKVPFNDFKGSRDEATFNIREKSVSLKVTDGEFSSDFAVCNTLCVLDRYGKDFAGGDVTKLYWISGADSFRDIPKWTSRWPELLEKANWLVVSRKGYSLDPMKVNPLQGYLQDQAWDSLLANNYIYEEVKPGVHRYHAKAATKPDLWVLNLEMPEIASSHIRERLRKGASSVELSEYLQPSVFDYIRLHGFYR